MACRGEFRADLYYRLRAVTVAVPPLRERVEDVPALAANFVAEYAREIEPDRAGRTDRPPLSAATFQRFLRSLGR